MQKSYFLCFIFTINNQIFINKIPLLAKMLYVGTKKKYKIDDFNKQDNILFISLSLAMIRYICAFLYLFENNGTKSQNPQDMLYKIIILTYKW